MTGSPRRPASGGPRASRTRPAGRGCWRRRGRGRRAARRGRRRAPPCRRRRRRGSGRRVRQPGMILVVERALLAAEHDQAVIAGGTRRHAARPATARRRSISAPDLGERRRRPGRAAFRRNSRRQGRASLAPTRDGRTGSMAAKPRRVGQGCGAMRLGESRTPDGMRLYAIGDVHGCDDMLGGGPREDRRRPRARARSPTTASSTSATTSTAGPIRPASSRGWPRLSAARSAGRLPARQPRPDARRLPRRPGRLRPDAGSTTAATRRCAPTASTPNRSLLGCDYTGLVAQASPRRCRRRIAPSSRRCRSPPASATTSSSTPGSGRACRSTGRTRRT